MSDEPKPGLERRDFIVASLAVAGASAALAAGAAARPRTPRQPAASGATVFTGDVIQGKRVVSALDVDDLEPGRHQLYFQGVETVTGQHWHVSVTVLKGARPGKRVLLTSGVHGDEMSSVRLLQLVVGQLDPAEMAGTVTAVFDISRPALDGMARRWPSSGRGIDLIDMNRMWPGDENGHEAPVRHAGLLFNRLLRPNADVALDFHTVSTGDGRHRLPLRRHVQPRGRGDGDAVSDRPDLRRHRRLRRHADERARRRGHPGDHARDRQAPRPRPRDDPQLRRRDDERAQASRGHRRADGPDRPGQRDFRRKARRAGHLDPRRLCRAPGRAPATRSRPDNGSPSSTTPSATRSRPTRARSPARSWRAAPTRPASRARR